MNESSQQERTGLVDKVVALAAGLGGLLRNRVELAALEFSEVRANLATYMMTLLLAVVMLWFAIAYWSALIVYLSWDALGWKIVPIVASAFTLAGVLLWRRARGMIEQGKLSMPATLAELRNDRDAFR